MREFVAARGRGDRGAMMHWWGQLVTEGWERLEKQVAITGRKVLWSDAERDDALSNAGMRLTRNVVWNFEGTTTDEFVACLLTVAKTACLDEQRKAATYASNKHSLDAPTRGEDSDSTAWADSVYADVDRERREAEEARVDMEKAMRLRTEAFLWALSQLDDKPRRVIELLGEGKLPAQIMEELDITRADVDQTKHRALKKLKKLMEQYRDEEDES